MDLILRDSLFTKKKPITNLNFKAESGLYGSTHNDFELTLPYDGSIVKGDIITCLGTEWGGRIFNTEISGNSMVLKGKTFRGQMELVSANPQSVLSVTGTDYEIIKKLIELTPLPYVVNKTTNTAKKTVVIPAGASLLKAIDLVLSDFGETMKIEAFSRVEITLNKVSTHRYDYSQTNLRLVENGMIPTAIHAVGKVNGTETAVSVYIQSNGTVGTTRYYTGFDAYEIAETLNDNCTSKSELQNIVSNRLLALRYSPLASEVDIKIDNAEIGDIINVTILKYGRKITQKVIAKAIEITNERIKQKLITGG